MKKIKIECLVIYIVLILLVTINYSFAGTDGQELQGAYDKLIGMIGGVGGKIIAAISGLGGLCGMALKFNWQPIATFFGVAIGVGTVSTIVDTTVTCILSF